MNCYTLNFVLQLKLELFFKYHLASNPKYKIKKANKNIPIFIHGNRNAVPILTIIRSHHFFKVRTLTDKATMQVHFYIILA